MQSEGGWSSQHCYFLPAFSITSGSEAKGGEGLCQCRSPGVGDPYLAHARDSTAGASLLSVHDSAGLQPAQQACACRSHVAERCVAVAWVSLAELELAEMVLAGW